MRNKCVQMSLFDSYSDVSRATEEDKPKFFRLLEKYINWEELIPPDFYWAFHKRMGRKRTYSLESFIRALVLQRIFGYTEDTQLLNTLRHSKEMRDFCGFDRVPDADKITRFKQNFSEKLRKLFYRLVEITEPICIEMNKELADCLIFDTTGIESYVAENNAKFANTKLKQAKNYAKSNPDYDPYKGVYSLFPEHAASNPAVKQQYINGHYCYAQKAVVITNALGIVRHIELLDEDFKAGHPEMIINKRTDNPEIDKEIGDSTALKPVLTEFFNAHPSLQYGTFMGDASFDSYNNYSLLLKDFRFKKALIPLNLRNSKSDSAEFDESGRPLCPSDGTPMTCLGKSGGKNRSPRLKWVCHKSIAKGNTRICTCENPCTTSSYGRCVYTYPDKDLRLYPGIARNSEQWDSLYNKRVTIERSIYTFKEHLCVNGRKTSNTAATKADLLLAGIVQLISVVLAKAVHDLGSARKIRRLIA